MAKKNTGKVIQMLTPENYIRTKSRTLPIYECWISSNWKVSKFPIILIARKHPNDNITYCTYMVDLLCLGVKNTFYSFNITLSTYNDQLNDIREEMHLKSCNYVLVHNIIYAALEFAEEFEFKPCKDFKSVTQYFLGEDTDDVELIEIECGDEDGQPVCVYSKLHDDLRKVQKIIAQLERTAGSGNYSVVDEDEEAEEFVDDDDFEDDEDFFGDKTFAEKKEVFLMLSSVEIESEKVDALIAVTNSMYRDIIDPQIVSNYYDEFFDELSVEILSDEVPNELLGLSSDDGTISDEVIDLFFEVLIAVDDDLDKARSKWEIFKKLAKGIPAVSYLELEILRIEKPKEYLAKRAKFALQYPSYSMIRLLEYNDLIQGGKFPNQNEIAKFTFDTIFQGRETLHRAEFFRYFLCFSFLIAHETNLNKLEALFELLDEFELEEKDFNLLEKTILFLKISALIEYLKK
ncbi:MAG: hypothetical protein GZ094_10970 [Mariniphaga sp.]|nr:hypothetical protein [Mariniphaga sp.]